MARWLFKQEPSCYSFDDLVRDGCTVWDGVANPLARKHLREMKAGDHILFYHTGKERAIVGEMIAISEPGPDPRGEDESAVVIVVEAIRKLANPVPLAAIKADKLLATWDLIRLPRLSVVPVSERQWKQVKSLSRGKERKKV